jgi:hypothetical protein
MKFRFKAKVNTMFVFMYRPSPQVPKPSVRAAILCYDAAAYNVKASAKDVENPSMDITWIFIQVMFMAINTLLWTISYKEVRSLHGKEELEELLRTALDIINKCKERWPGCASAAQLYETLGKACLKSYNIDAHPPSSLSANSPVSLTDANSPSASEHSSATTGSLAHSHKAHDTPPTFGYVFDQAPDSFAATEYHNSLQAPQQPSFRSNSIFVNPASAQTDRRFSYFPPEFNQPQTLPNSWTPIPAPAPAPNIQLNVSTSPPMPTFNSFGDPSYFMQPQYNFGPALYADNFDMPDRTGSLSHQQQQELMESLETEGLTRSFLTFGADLYDPGKS